MGMAEVEAGIGKRSVTSGLGVEFHEEPIQQILITDEGPAGRITIRTGQERNRGQAIAKGQSRLLEPCFRL